ncbi:MAG: POTRA domain-containing protein [Tenacibaculum sp.]
MALEKLKKLIFIFLLLFAILYNTVAISQNNLISDIEINGLKKTSKLTVLKFLETKKGQVLDSALLSKDIIALKKLPAFSNAYFTVKKLLENKYLLVISVEENFTLIPVINLWSTTNKKLAYKVGLNEYNFLGKHIALEGYYQRNVFNSYGLNFKAPMLFSKRIGLAFYHQNWISEEPLYFNSQSANYRYQNISFEALLLFKYNFKNNLDFGLNFFKEKYLYLNGHISSDIPQRVDADKKLLKLVYTFDNLDYFYHYVSGFKNQFYGQYVTTETPFQDDFLIAWNDFFYFKRIGENGNWANRFRFGLSSNYEAPFAPFALDNNINLRGVGILVDRGTGSVVWNTEYRHTLYQKRWFVLQGNIFADSGTWRLPGGKLTDFVKNENIRVYSGIGLRFISKKIFNAIFRIDYGYGLTKNASKGFVFGIGQYF